MDGRKPAIARDMCACQAEAACCHSGVAEASTVTTVSTSPVQLHHDLSSLAWRDIRCTSQWLWHCPLALQDPETGLPLHRREQLVQVFKIIDKVGIALTAEGTLVQ